MRKLLTLGLFLLISVVAFAQQTVVTGTVFDSSGMPVPGVNVQLKDAKSGTATDFDGKYEITVNSSETALMFSYVGFLTQEIVVGGRSTINVTLEEDVAQLDEVVVVGYGTQKKENLTGAVSSVKMQDVLGDRPIVNPVESLQGMIPGMQVTSTSGQPGSQGLGIQIRGATSLNGGSALILMDNVPVNFGDINPQDIETITVLKDAAAASIYGARAAFGVVLITTKKGSKNQKLKFNYSGTTSINYPENLPTKASTYDFINALQDFGQDTFWIGQDIDTWVDYLEEYKNNPGAYPEGVAYDENGQEYPLKDTSLLEDFLDEGGFSQIHNFSFNGGGENVAYRVSTGYTEVDGIMVTDNDKTKKNTVNAYLKADLSSKIASTSNVLFTATDTNFPIGDYGRAVNYSPFAREGFYTDEEGNETPYYTPENQERFGVSTNRKTSNIRLFQKLEYNPIPGLNFTGEYTYEQKYRDFYSGDNQQEYIHPESLSTFGGVPESTFYRKANDKEVSHLINMYGSYTKSFGNHNFKFLAGMNREDVDFEYFYIRKTDLISVDLPSISTATGVLEGDDSFYGYATLGYFGRLNYNYKEKYFIELNGRYDGSSRFAEDDRYGFFPSASVGWTVTKENFMKNVGFLNHLHFRGSYGEIGNQNVTRGGSQQYYPYLPEIGVTNASWLDESTGLRYRTLGLPDLVSAGFTWETVRSANFGVDIRMFKNKFSGSFDIYERKTLDMITVGAQLPATLGASPPDTNAADLKSSGWELSVNWKDKIGDFSYNIGATLSDGQSEITKFDNPGGLISEYYAGQQIGEIWGYVSDGFYTVDDFEEGTLDENLMNGTLKEGVPVFQGRSPNPGDTKYKDLNGDGIIFSGEGTLDDPGDRQVIGNTTRRYQYGIFGGANFKGFDFSFILNGVGKRDLWRNDPIRFPFVGEFNIIYDHQMDYWTPENTDAYFPRNYVNGGVNYGNSRLTQTKYLLDGSYLRIKNLTFGYSLPKSVLDKIKMDKVRIFVMGENLYSFDDLPDGINTELANQGQGAAYPYLTSYSLGVNISF
ncbi:SusC/RagA family TonB-linked outer membrane protein [Joostella sp. CR20]|uniref:SusC/RagA family TonB-linked outer membrane protein n=1 Tax=Joostella sp. CR20 TaxID=2804312 RepID=UPI00313CC0EB